MNTYSAASAQADHVSQSRKCNRAYATILMQRQLPGMVLFLRNVAASITDALAILGSTFQRFLPARSRPRPIRHVKPHPSLVYKG